MTVETATKISQLNAAAPPGSDPKSEGDNHLRLIKGCLQAVFDDSGTTLKTTLPIESPGGAKINGDVAIAGDATVATINGKPVVYKTARQNNLIVNPSMSVSQENGATAGSVANYYVVDQFYMTFVGPVCSGQQVLGWSPDNSPNRVRKTVTTPKASLAAGDFSCVQQPIEGTRIVPLAYGTAGAIQSVLRIGFKGPAGTYSISLRNGPTSNRSYVKNFTIAAGQANTDTVQTFVIPGDTAGTWNGDNTLGMILSVFDAVGATGQGVEGWQAGAIYGTAANSNMVATNGNVVELFDVGFYPDPEKTGLPPPFIAPKYSDALIDCKRYYEKVGLLLTATAFTNTGYFGVDKRTAPTFALLPTSGTGASVVGMAVNPAAPGFSSFYQNSNHSLTVQSTVIGNARM